MSLDTDACNDDRQEHISPLQCCPRSLVERIESDRSTTFRTISKGCCQRHRGSCSNDQSTFHSHPSSYSIPSSIQVLDSSYTQENHRQCIETSRPLLQSIDELYTYAMSKEFASVPATISATVRFPRNDELCHSTASFGSSRDGSCKSLFYRPHEMSSMERATLSNAPKV